MSFADNGGNLRAIRKPGPRVMGWQVISVVLATWLQFGLRRLGPVSTPFLLYIPTIMSVSLLAGLGPGILVTALSVIAGAHYFLHTPGAWTFGPVHFLVSVLAACVGLSLALPRIRAAWRSAAPCV